MDVQLVSDLMCQLNDNEDVLQENALADSDFLGSDVANNLTKRISFNVTPNGSTNITSNVPSNVTSNVPSNLPSNLPTNLPTNVPVNISRTVRSVPRPLNQIPRNLAQRGTPNGVSTSSNTTGGKNIRSILKNTGGATVPDTQVTDTVTSSDFYSIFGFQLSKTTVYLIIGFIILVVAYYLYKYFTASDSKDKKRKQNVSYDQQMKTQARSKDEDTDDEAKLEKTSDE